MVRVVLCKERAWERCEELEKVEGFWVGVRSIVEIIREVLSVAVEAEAEFEDEMGEVKGIGMRGGNVRPAVIAFSCCFGRAGPTGICCSRSAEGSCL